MALKNPKDIIHQIEQKRKIFDLQERHAIRDNNFITGYNIGHILLCNIKCNGRMI